MTYFHSQQKNEYAAQLFSAMLQPPPQSGKAAVSVEIKVPARTLRHFMSNSISKMASDMNLMKQTSVKPDPSAILKGKSIVSGPTFLDQHQSSSGDHTTQVTSCIKSGFAHRSNQQRNQSRDLVTYRTVSQTQASKSKTGFSPFSTRTLNISAIEDTKLDTSYTNQQNQQKSFEKRLESPPQVVEAHEDGIQIPQEKQKMRATFNLKLVTANPVSLQDKTDLHQNSEIHVANSQQLAHLKTPINRNSVGVHSSQQQQWLMNQNARPAIHRVHIITSPPSTTKANSNRLEVLQFVEHKENVFDVGQSAGRKQASSQLASYSQLAKQNENKSTSSHQRSTSVPGNSTGHNKNSQKIQFKLFAGVPDKVVPRVQGGSTFQPISLPHNLKKFQKANQVMDRYLQIKSPNTLSERDVTRSSDKQNQQTLFSNEQNDEQDNQMHFQSMDDVSNLEETAAYFSKDFDKLNKLEVLEERSNETNSPCIKDKKARDILQRCTSSPTNFQNQSRSRKNTPSPHQNKTLTSFIQIKLRDSRQRSLSPALKLQPVESPRATQVQEKVTDSNLTNDARRLETSLDNRSQEVDTSHFSLIDTTSFVHMSLAVFELQQKMNSGVFITGGVTSSNFLSTNLTQQHPQVNNSMQGKQEASQGAPQSSDDHQNNAGANFEQNHNQNPQQNTHYPQPGQTQQIPFRGVAINGQHPPHLSQQAQQMLQHKMQSQQNAQSKFRQSNITSSIAIMNPYDQKNQILNNNKNSRILASVTQISMTPSQQASQKLQQQFQPPVVRPSSNHRVLAAIKQSQAQAGVPEPEASIKVDEKMVEKQQKPQQSTNAAKQPRTYKEIRQKLYQQQQMQILRQQQQQWIHKQQQILLANNPGITIEQVNAIIQQSIINQQQQMVLQQQQQQALLQQAAAISSQPSTESQTTVTEDEDPHRSQPQVIRVTKKQTGSINLPLGGATANNNANQQVQIKQNVNGQISIALAVNNAPQPQPIPVYPPMPSHMNQRNHLVSSQQTMTQQKTQVSESVVLKNEKNENLMSYAQLLKNECQYDGGNNQSLNYKPNSLQSNLQPTILPFENLKHTLQQLTSEILRKVLARSDGMNLLRQIIDLKAKKVKPKNFETGIFQTIIDKEQQRVTQENVSLQKGLLRIEDKTLVKYLRGQVKKMLKPFRGLQYDDFLNNEIHLNEIMATQDQQNDPIKESRKRHLRILDAALKEQCVDIQIVLGICVQISRQAFYNELIQYFDCAYDFVMANQSQFQNHDIQGIQILKKKITSVRTHSKVQIQSTKKLDRMFWLLLEQNQEVRNNIQTYKERYIEKTENGGVNSGQPENAQNSTSNQNGGYNLGSASQNGRKQNTLRSSSNVGNSSPQVNAGNSSHNIFSGANHQKNAEGTIRRTIKGSRSSNLQQESYNNNNGGKNLAQTGNKPTLSQSQDVSEAISFAATTSKAQQLILKNAGKISYLVPIHQNNPVKKAQSLIQKKMKARDLDRQLNNQQTQQNIGSIEKPQDQLSVAKKRMSSTKGQQIQHISATPQTFNPRSKNLNAISTNLYNQGQQIPIGGIRSSASNNSTENLFNLIQAKKTKNTMRLEPLDQKHRKNESLIQRQPQESNQIDEIGSGLQGSNLNQKSHRMRQTDYSRGFFSNLEDGENGRGGNVQHVNFRNMKVAESTAVQPASPSKVFRSWSRPQITPDLEADGNQVKTTQVCICAKFRKRIEQPNMADLPPKTDKRMSVTLKKEKLQEDQISTSDYAHNLINTDEHSQLAKSEFKGSRSKIDQDEICTPGGHHNQPRMSQDFKMRILTKKKVTVPSTAGIHHQSHQNFNQSHDSSSLDHSQSVAIPNRSNTEEIISNRPNGSVLDKYPGGTNSSLVLRQKIVTYELCQECGGSRPAGLPQVTSSLSEIKVKLQVQKVPGFNLVERDKSAPLNDSNRSSTLSLGNGSDDSQLKSYDMKVQQQLLNNNVNLGRIKADNLFESHMNVRYVSALGVNTIALQEFVANNRARKIQSVFQQWYALRLIAAKIIQRKWRLYKKRKSQSALQMLKIAQLRQKVAINRIYDLHRLIKVRKVTFSQQLHYQQICENLNQCQQDHPNYFEMIIRIQRKWRSHLSNKYIVGKALVAKKQRRKQIWHDVMCRKYNKVQLLESNLQLTQTMFMREMKNIEGYFQKQGLNYTKDLETRAAKIIHRLNAEFVLAEWQFEPLVREWHNTSKSLSIRLTKTESSHANVLREKLVQFYLSNQLPSQDAINRQLDDFGDARTAMQKALKKEEDYKKRLILQRIKRQRLDNLYRKDIEIVVERL